MNIYPSLKNTLTTTLLYTAAFLFLVSCGTTQQAYDTDGIYSDGTTAATTSNVIPEREVATNNNSQIYKNYFEKGAQELQVLEEDNAIFTDVDAYTSEEGTEIYVDGLDFETSTGYAAWGDQPQDIEINVYNDPFIGGFGFGGFGFNRFGFGGPFGFNRFGFGGFGFNRFGFGGFGPFGFGGFGPFGYGGFGHFGFGGFGGFGYNPYFFYGNRFSGFHNGFNNFNNGHFGRGDNGVAFNGGRRNSNARDVIAASRSRLRDGRTAASRSRNTYARDKGIGRTNNRNGVRPDSRVRNGQARGTSTRPNARPTVRNGNVRPSSRPNARPQGSNSRPSARPARSNSRPSARPNRGSSRPSFSRPSSRSRSGGSFSRGGGSSRSFGGGRSGGRSGGRRG